MLADLPRHKIDRNQRLIQLATRALKGKGVSEFEYDQMSIDSNEMVATQEDVDKGDEDIDGIEISNDLFTQIVTE